MTNSHLQFFELVADRPNGKLGKQLLALQKRLKQDEIAAPLRLGPNVVAHRGSRDVNSGANRAVIAGLRGGADVEKMDCKEMLTRKDC